MGKLEVVKVGLLASIQDEGRFGLRQFGIPQAGAMDLASMHDANELVGNEFNAPVIEIAMQGLTLQSQADTIVAVTGAYGAIHLDGEEVRMYESFEVLKGQTLSISPSTQGVYTYLGIAGMLEATKDFDSYATYMLAGFGGLEGRALRKGDELHTSGEKSFEKKRKRARDFGVINKVRIMKGPEWALLHDLPEGRSFTIDPSSNRMGIRLTGSALEIEKQEVLSSAVIPGTIQLPQDGNPIILMKDCQTTGGYPRIGKVLDEDLGILAQARPGEMVTFELIEDA